MAAMDVHPVTTIINNNNKKNTSTSPWAAPPRFDINSILTIINNNNSNHNKTNPNPKPKPNTTCNKDDYANSLSKWSWNWEPIDFKTSSVKCPKALNTLLGKRFSTSNPSGICPPPCTSPSHGCTCKINNNNNEESSLPFSAQATALVPDQNKYTNVNSNESILEDGELEEGQISGEMEMEEEENEDLSVDCKEAPVASQAEAYHHFGYDYGTVPHNSLILQKQVAVQWSLEENTKKPQKTRNQRRKKQRQTKAKIARESLQLQGKKKKGDLIGKFKDLVCVDKQTVKEPVKQGGEDEEKLTAKKNGDITLSSFFEGEIGLWTTQTVDEVLRDTKAEEGGNKKAKRGPLTEERKLKRKIAKNKKKAIKDKQLGIKRLKLAPVTKPKPVIICKFYMKGRCAQGKLCPFSHDAVPITKSEICKYYVNNCCLKADECPFSHDLSTFPCKFYHTKDGCLDGDDCRFSHKPITEKELEKLLKQNELGKQDLYEQESAPSTIQHIFPNNLQKSDVHSTFSVGDQFENVNLVELSKSSLENNQQMCKEERASSGFLNSGKAAFVEPLVTANAVEQQMPRLNGANSCVSGNSLFPQYERLDYHLVAEAENDAFIAARKAAFNALAPLADHEANLISRGLVRVPTFISSAYPAADRGMDFSYFGSCGTGKENKEAHEESCSEHLMGENRKISPTGLLNSSKSAMKILEEILSGKTNPTDK